MNNLFILAAIVLLFLLYACSRAGFGEKAASLEKADVIIDVRTKAEYDAGHLTNAINIPHTEIKTKIKNHVIAKEKVIALYCRSGRRSGIAKKILEELGYANVQNAGAYSRLK